MVVPKADQSAEDWAVLKVARMVVKKADWTVDRMAVLMADNLDMMRAVMMAASMVARRANKTAVH